MKKLFTPVDWSMNTNLYEVNVRQYTQQGTFSAFAEHLPRLRDMGVETLWFMPVTPISREGRLGVLGSYYACSDYTAINPEYGTLDDFKALVKKAQELGFKVIIDWVANHTGKDHVWVASHSNFYKKTSDGKFYDTNGWEDVIDLNYYDYELRRFMIDAMTFWVKECNIDGFRCDMAHLVPLDFWRQARIALDAVKPLYWLGETDDEHYLEVFDSHYTWRWMHETEKFFVGNSSLAKLVEVLNQYEVSFPADAQHVYFTSNHDENSWNGTEYEKYGDAALALAVFSCTWDSIPLMYSGQELPNHKRLRFFEKDLIEWNDKPALHSFYQTLFQLRKTHPAIKAGKASPPQWLPINVSNYVLAFMRRSQGKDVVVLLNLSPNNLFVQMPQGYVTGKFTNVFDGQQIDMIPQASIELKSWGYKVLVN
ncbi:MAG: alpha-amylase family glycosyl hydrolase [Chitinophagaceae bacterium]